jgi:hypothetical protein
MKRICLLLLLWPVIARAQPTPFQWHLQTGLAVAPSASFHPTMAYDPVRDVVLCVPSRAESGDIRDYPGTWRWDGNEWTLPTDASTTDRRYAVGIAFDTVRGVAVLYCEGGNGLVDDILKPGITWELDGSVWRLASTNGPQNRDNMGMAFDSHRGRTIIFGGSTGFAGPVPAWTWEWDGTNWHVMATNGPSRRVNCAMAYDAKRRVTILFGGTDAFDVERRDTWAWDGTDWTPVAVAGPTARSLHGMVYDTVRERVLLYGGWNDGSQPIGEEGLGDGWEWDGSQWLHSSSSGPRLDSRALAFDSRRGESVVFGGNRNRTELLETWLLKLHETWVDFSYVGIETGAFDTPFNTLGEGVNVTPEGSVVKIKTGSTLETPTISKRLSVQAFGGPVTIGQ